MAHILVAPLSWGLGHATRDIPVIREFLKRGHRVSIASSGRALALLKQEFPQCSFLTVPDYPTPYTSTGLFLVKFASFIPRMLAAIRAEQRVFRDILSGGDYDLVLSDNRFNACSQRIPSFFISHQLRFSVPGPLKFIEFIAQLFNSSHHRKFIRVLVPDNPPQAGSLSGTLSVSRIPATRSRIYYAGILSSVRKLNVPEDIDVLFSISGPEPQRTEFEKVVLRQIGNVPGRKVVLLGTPDRNGERRLDENTLVKFHAGREEMSELMNRAKCIVTRSGYTTMMEMAELGKKCGLFVPTPGQTEQVYLSEYYRKQGWFLSCSQYRLDLARDLERTAGFSGFPPMPGTEENTRRLYDEVFKPYL